VADQKLSNRVEISVPQDSDLVHIVQNGTSYKIQYKNLVPEPPAAPDFHGSLAIADTPTLDGYYFASESGTYTNAGNLEVDLGTGLAIIIKKGGNYSLLYHATGEDKIEFYNDFASFPVAGIPNVAYIDKSSGSIYLWNQTNAAYEAVVSGGGGSRTVKEVPNTTQYTVIAADFTDFILEFTANANEEIDIIINSGVAPLNGELQMISTGNNKLVPSLTGVTATYPEQTNPKTILKGWLGGIVVGADKISFNGSLESTATAGIEEAPQDGTPYSRQDAGWVAAVDNDTTYTTFTNTEDGLVAAPNITTEYSATITSPTEGFTATEGQVTTVNVNLPAATTGEQKMLFSYGWALPTFLDKFDYGLYYFPTLNNGDSLNRVLSNYGSERIIAYKYNSSTDGSVSIVDLDKDITHVQSRLARLTLTALPENFTIVVPNGCLPIIRKGGVAVLHKGYTSNGSGGTYLHVTGDLVKEYEVFKSPNGTLYKAAITDLGQWDITAL
jgi:hypothetical protein